MLTSFGIPSLLLVLGKVAYPLGASLAICKAGRAGCENWVSRGAEGAGHRGWHTAGALSAGALVVISWVEISDAL